MPRRSCSLYVRNLPDSCRTEDLRRTFGRFGPIVDVTMPTDYYSGRTKDPRDADDAHRSLDHSRFLGGRIEVEFTRGTRKTPAEMRGRDRRGDSPRRRSRSISGSPRRRRSRSVSNEARRGGRVDGNLGRSLSRSPSPSPRKLSRRGVEDEGGFNNGVEQRDRSGPRRRRVSSSRSRSAT